MTRSTCPWCGEPSSTNSPICESCARLAEREAAYREREAKRLAKHPTDKKKTP